MVLQKNIKGYVDKEFSSVLIEILVTEKTRQRGLRPYQRISILDYL